MRDVLAVASSAGLLESISGVVAGLGAEQLSSAAMAEFVVRDASWLVADGAAIWLSGSGEQPVARAGVVREQVLAGVADVVGGAAGGRGHDCRHPVHRDCLGGEDWNGIGAVAVIPVVTRGRQVGSLAVVRAATRPSFASDELRFLQILAGLVAVGVDRDTLVEHATVAFDEVRRHSELIDHVSDAIISVGPDLRVSSWNASAERIYGYSAGEAAGCELFSLLATRLQATDGTPVELEAALAEALSTGGWRGELRERSSLGAELQILTAFAAVTDDAGEQAGFVIVNRDLTEQRRKEHAATHDTLTGLPNRAQLTERLRRAVLRSPTAAGQLAVLFLDLNGFKQINDRLGHEAGDDVLAETARRLRTAVRRHDLVARLGGDEFVVVAEDVEDATDLARRILAATSQPIIVAGQPVYAPPSIGVALSSGGDDPDDLLRAADAAMYRAKQGKTGVAVAA